MCQGNTKINKAQPYSQPRQGATVVRNRRQGSIRQTHEHGNQIRGNQGIETAIIETKLPPLALRSPVVFLTSPMGFLVSASLARDHLSLFATGSSWETAEPTTSWLVTVSLGSSIEKDRIGFLANQLNTGKRLGTNTVPKPAFQQGL